MKFPIIESEKIILRELKEEDSSSLFTVYSNELAMKYWDSKCHENLSTTIQALHKMKESWYKEQGITWGIVIKNSQQLIG